MSKFDVYINGIQLDHLSNKAKVNEKTSACLKIPIKLIEKLLDSPNTRIRQSVTEIKAQQYKNILCQIGVICFYKPVSPKLKNVEDSVDLSTKNIQHTSRCPNCNHQISQTNNETLPNECDNCGIFIDLYLAHQSAKKNKVKTQPHHPQIQNKPITSQQNQKTKIKKLKPLNLQKAEPDNPKKLNEKKFKLQPLTYVGGILSLTALTGILYAFSNNDKSVSLTTIAAKDTTIETSHPISQAVEATSSIASTNNKTSPQPISNPFDEEIKDSQQNSSSTAIATNKNNINVSNSILHFSLDNQEWDNFLSHKIDDSIAEGNLERSHRLIACLSDPEKHINSLAKLLVTTRENEFKKDILLKMEDKIKLSPAEIKPQLLSLAGRHQLDLELKNNFYKRAEKKLNALSEPKKKLAATLRIATSFYKDGDIESTNRYLTKITELLPKINADNANDQIQSRVAISRAYKDTDNLQYALSWIKDSENLIDQADETTIQTLVEGYAYLEQHSSVIRLIKRALSIPNRDARLFSAIKTYLATEQTERAIKLNRSMQGATYRALSYILIATYSEENQNYSILAESILNAEIHSPIEKAFVSSRLAQLQARQYNIYKTEKLLKITKEQIATIPASPEKDKLLNIVATNYARSLMFKPATTFISDIQSSDIKLQFNKDYRNLSKLTAL